MKKSRSCNECLLIFKQVGFLTTEERIKKHKEHPHTVECRECSRKFISRTHLQFHVECYHNTRCGDCITFCGSMCTINYAKRMELRNEELLEAGLVEKAEAAEAAAEDLEKCIKKKVKLSSLLAQDMARLLDSGFDGPEALHWSRIVYLPAAKNPEVTLSARVKEWVRLTILEAAFDEQAARIRSTKVSECPISKCRASVFDEWEHRWSCHPDSSNRHWKTGSEISFMKGNYTSTAGGSNPRRQSREEEGEEDETETMEMT